MPADAPARHFLPPALEGRPITVVLVGCGGNGAQLLMGLASLDTALRAISSRSLEVTVVDDDVVTEANLGRQPFYRCDLGNSKARTLTERINIAHGLAWRAVHGRAPVDTGVNFDLVITAVDTASARRAIGAAIAADDAPPRYWLDLGNRATDGQFVLGYTGRGERKPTGPRLRTVLEHFPELADESLPDDDAPSCSVAEALERQSLFINRTLASHALALLFDLLGRGSIGHTGGFLNLATGQVLPIALPPVAETQS